MARKGLWSLEWNQQGAHVSIPGGAFSRGIDGKKRVRPSRYDLHYVGAGDTKGTRESLYFRSDSGVFGSATIMSPRPTLPRRAALYCTTVSFP